MSNTRVFGKVAGSDPPEFAAISVNDDGELVVNVDATVETKPYQAAGTDRSGTITTGGTAQNAAAALATRRYLYVTNPFLKSDGSANPAEPLWVNFTGAANGGSGSIRLDPGGWWENPPHYCPTGAISVLAATTGHAWTAKEA
jgi:hypothetical protein